MTHDIEQINKVYSKFNMTVTESIKGLRINKYKLLITDYDDVSKFVTKKMLNNLIAALGENSVKLYLDGSYVVIEKKAAEQVVLNMDECFTPSFINHPTNDLRIILGKDIEGKTVVTSLAKAPHMLVSGCTGSGKTVFLHSCISSILLGNNTVHLILVDPKGSEFSVYKDIDTVEFISDVAKANKTLRWLVQEMNSRYKTMEQQGTNNIEDTSLSKIVVVIDEFADLIGQDKSIEKSVVMLAQKSRAAGIHLIIGTQYPKAEVLTGLIQANIPTRVCLKVNTNIQSRIAINVSGGEKLLEHGDMLFINGSMTETIRIQAPFISAYDKHKVIKIAKERFTGKGGYVMRRKQESKGYPTNDNSPSKAEVEEYINRFYPHYSESARKKLLSDTSWYTGAKWNDSRTKKVGIIESIISLFKVKPIMFQTEEYPPRI